MSRWISAGERLPINDGSAEVVVFGQEERAWFEGGLFWTNSSFSRRRKYGVEYWRFPSGDTEEARDQ